MFDTSCELHSQSRKIKKNWLIAAWVTYLVTLIRLTFWTGFFVCAVGWSSVVIYLFALATGLIEFWITYHCAYKNNGTAWLLFLMIIIPFFFVCNFATEDVYTLLNEYKLNGSLYGLINVSIRAALTLYYLINCYRLYQLNKSRIHKRQDANA